MSDRLKALREKRAKLVTDMRAITEAAEKEKRDLSGEELANHDKLFNEVEAARKQIEAEERTIEATRQAAESEAEKQEREGKDKQKSAVKTPDQERRELLMKGFRTFLGTGKMNGDGAEELRALQAGSDVEGGFTVVPQQFVADLLKGVDDETFIRGLATKWQITRSESLGVPTLDTDLDDADWTVELGTGNEDTAMRFGKRELRPHPVAKRIKVSKKLLRVSVLPIEAIIMQRMQYKFGVTCEKAYLLGTGSQQPLGMFVASADGIPTSRDVSAGNTSTSVTFDGLIEAKYTLKAKYWPKARWLFHRDVVKAISKLKDGEGGYLWRPSVREGEPDRILDKPFMMSEFAPNTLTTGQYVGLFADFSHYWIADALDMQVQALLELYAETNQNGYIGRLETDGMPVLAEAFVRVKLG